MLTYNDVKVYVTAGLTALGYGASNPNVAETARTLPYIDHGPFQIDRRTKLSPSTMLFLTVGNGAGLTTEGLYDRVFITVRAVGLQNDYGSAERLAHDVDRLLLLICNGETLGASRTLYINRTGGAPQLVDWDAADRYHFQATYIAETKR